MSIRKGTSLCLILGLVLALSTAQTSLAAVYDVSAGTDSIIYSPGDNVTITGLVRNAVTLQPVSGSSVTMAVTKGSSSVCSDSASTDSSGKFQSDPCGVSETGTYTFQASTSGGSVTGYFDVESEKRYTLSTDQYTYSPGDTATITLDVAELPDETPAPGESITLKIKRTNGTVEHTGTLTTSASGRATATFTIPGYDEYVAVAGKGLAMAVFEAPSFNMKVSVLGSDGKKKDMFDSSGSLKVKATATKDSSSAGTVTAVKNVDVTVYVKDISGNTLHTFNSSTETSDGIYETGYYSLSSLSNGDYYVQVRAEKGSSQMKAKSFFSIKSLRVDVVPIGEMEGVMSFLMGEQVSLGLFVMNMGTGDILTGDEIYGAEIVGCTDSKGKSCLSLIQGATDSTSEGFRDFSRILRFTAPNKTGEYFIEVRVNTTSGTGRGGGHIYVQNVIAYAETLDQFDSWRWRYGPGESITFRVNAFSGGYSSQASVSGLEILEIRNDSWGDVTDSVITNSSRLTSSGSSISLSAPDNSGWYNVKLKATTSDGTAYTGAHFEVQLYDLWADIMDGPYIDSSWNWRFGSSDNVYFHINVYDLGGQTEDNRINSSDYAVKVSRLRYEETGKVYSNLNVTSLEDDSWGRPVLKLNLGSLSLSSGHYAAEIELTDTDGNKGYFEAWFKISNLDVWTETTTNSGEQGKWRFSPSDNVTIKTHCRYFNGTALPDGTAVLVDDLMYAQKGPPMPVPSDVWDGYSGTTTSGEALIRVRAASGQSLSQGQYMVLINVTPPGSSTSEIAEAWFEVSALDVYGWAQPPYVGTGDNISIMVSASKIDGTAINTTISLVELRDASTWSDVMGRLDDPPADKSSSQTTTSFSFNTTGLSTGNYEAVLRVNCPELGAKSEVYAWFTIENYQIYGEFVDASDNVFAPGENVEMYITVSHPNGTYMGGQNVEVYQLVNTKSYPWSFKDATMVGTPDPTDSYSGKARVTFKAPSTSGRYRPMVNVSGELQTDPWLMPDFVVRSADVRVSLHDSSGNPMDDFSTGSDVQVRVDVSSPTGGTVSLSSISMRYKSLASGQETSLQTLTSGLGSTNWLNFTSPTEEGEYVLYVSVTDNTTGNVIIEKRWFQVKTFDVWWWMDQWSVSPGDDAAVHIEGWTPGGAAADFNVSLLELRDMWTWENASGYSIGDGSPERISGSGTYNISTLGLDMGEYEATLCIYDPSQGCLSGSQRLYVGFSVQSHEIYTWPMQGSFTTSDEVRLAVEVNDNGLQLPDDVEFMSLRNEKTWADATSSISALSNTTQGSTWIVSFPASDLTPGEYSMRVNVTYSGESRTREIWFRISDYSLSIDTVPPTGGQGGREFSLGQEITFNVSVIPAPSIDTPGKLILKDDMSWQEVASTDVTINSTTGFATQVFTFNEPGFYTLIAQAGDAEEFLWFEVDAFDIFFNHEMSEHQLEPGQLLNMTFNITYPNGTEFSGDINITCMNIRKTWDWGTVDGTSNLEPRTVTASLGSWESYNLTLPGGIGAGEYEAELEFSTGGISTKDHFWFQLRTKQFDAWTGAGSYEPGDEVNIKAELRYSNGSAWSDVNISIEEIWSKDSWQEVDVSYTTPYADTGSQGRVTLNFTLPADVSGMIDVKLKENTGGETRWLSFDVNSFDISVYRPNNKWMYLPGEVFDSDIYVSKSGIPQSGVNISARVWESGTEWSEGNEAMSVYPSGLTDSEGYKSLNFTVPSGTGHYEIEILAASGAARAWEGFDVATFFVDAWIDGNVSGMETVSPGEGIIITVYVKDPSGTRIEGANVSIIEVMDEQNWSPVAVTKTKDNQSTDYSGRAELKLIAPQTAGEYIVRLNVSYNDSGTVTSSVREAWFKVSRFSTSIQLVCPPGAPDNCNPNSVPAGGNLVARSTVSGNGLVSTTLCLENVRSMWTGMDTQYDLCNTTSAADNTSMTTIAFSAPQDYGDYDAQFELQITDQLDSDYTDDYRWFKVEGDSSGIMLSGWIEPNSPWSGTNATAYIEAWDSSWYPVDLSSCQAEISEIRDSMSWSVVKNGSEVSQWNLGEVQGGMGPDGAIQMVFEIPSDLPYGDYEARVEVSCPDETSLENFMHFRVPAFQVSSLMREIVRSDEEVKFWFRVTDNNGNPVTGTVHKDRLVDEWTWSIIEEYSEQIDLSSLGEVSGNITSPSEPGQYMLEMRIENSSVTQNMNRWFRIQGLRVKAQLDKSKYFTNEDPILTIQVNDTSGDPVGGAWISLDVFSMMKGPMEGDGEEDNTSGGSYETSSIYINNNTDADGRWVVNLTQAFESQEANLSSGDYMLFGQVDKADYGWTEFESNFMIRILNTSVNLGGSSEFQPGDSVPVFVTVLNASGEPVEGINISASLEVMQMMGPENESEEDEGMLAEHSGQTNDTGMFDTILQIPPYENVTGPAVVFVEIEDRYMGQNISEEEQFLIVVHSLSSRLNITGESGPHSAGDMFSIHIEGNLTANLAMAPFVRHMAKTGDAVPMFEIMGGGPSSGKEDYYENSLYFNTTGAIHAKVLARSNPGNYTLMIPFFDKDSQSMMDSEPEDVLLYDYEVVA